MEEHKLMKTETHTCFLGAILNTPFLTPWNCLTGLDFWAGLAAPLDLTLILPCGIIYKHS